MRELNCAVCGRLIDKKEFVLERYERDDSSYPWNFIEHLYFDTVECLQEYLSK